MGQEPIVQVGPIKTTDIKRSHGRDMLGELVDGTWELKDFYELQRVRRVVFRFEMGEEEGFAPLIQLTVRLYKLRYIVYLQISCSDVDEFWSVEELFLT